MISYKPDGSVLFANSVCSCQSCMVGNFLDCTGRDLSSADNLPITKVHRLSSATYFTEPAESPEDEEPLADEDGYDDDELEPNEIVLDKDSVSFVAVVVLYSPGEAREHCMFLGFTNT